LKGKNIQIELYRILQNLIEKKFSYDDVEFVGVMFEPTINGRPDLVIEAIDKGKKLPVRKIFILRGYIVRIKIGYWS